MFLVLASSELSMMACAWTSRRILSLAFALACSTVHSDSPSSRLASEPYLSSQCRVSLLSIMSSSSSMRLSALSIYTAKSCAYWFFLRLYDTLLHLLLNYMNCSGVMCKSSGFTPGAFAAHQSCRRMMSLSPATDMSLKSKSGLRL